MRRAIVAVAACLLTGAAALAFGSSPALAHAGLEASTPAASSVLEDSPPLIVLDFDEEIDTPLTSIQLYDQDGSGISLGGPEQAADGTQVQASVPALDDGTYAVVWRISSADGHVVTGAFSFQVGTAGGVNAGKLVDSVLNGARADPSVGRGLGIARFASFLGVVLLLGGLVMVMMTAGGAEIGWSARRVLWIGWAFALLGALANFGLLGANSTAGSVGDAFDTSVWGDIADTRTGGLLVVRLVLIVVLAAVLVVLDRRRTTWWRTSVPLLAVLTIFTFSGGGHPSVQSRPAFWMSVDAVHLGFIVLWLGGLAMMAVGGRAWLRDDSLVPAVHSFSKTATIGVPLIVATGVLQTWKLGGGLAALTDTTWGRILLAKGCVAILVVTIGGASRWLLQNDGPSALRRTVLTEALMGVAVLGLAASMVGLPPEAGQQSKIYTATLTEAGVIAEVTITPGIVGANQVHIVVTPPGGGITQVTSLTARMSLPAREIPFTPVTLINDGVNHYTGNITLAFAGDWTLELVVLPDPEQSILLTSTVPIPELNG